MAPGQASLISHHDQSLLLGATRSCQTMEHKRQLEVPERSGQTTRALLHSPIPGQNPSENVQTRSKPRMRASINIATLNMNGLAAQDGDTNPNGKWKWVNRTLNENKIAILALQETHLDQTTVDRIRKDYNRKMEIMFSADPDSPRARAGVAFIINKTLIAPREIIMHEILPGRALLIKIKWLESEETNILNIYAPNNKSSHPTFWKRIEDTRMRKRLPRPDFMLGDFNVTEDKIDRAPAKPDN